MRVGLDVGGTKTDAVVVDAGRRRSSARVRLATGWGAEAVIDTVIAAVHAVAHGRRRRPGVDPLGRYRHPRSGRAGHRPRPARGEPRRRRADLGAAVAAELGVTVRVENDVKAAGLGAHALHRAGGDPSTRWRTSTSAPASPPASSSAEGSGAAHTAQPARSGTSRSTRSVRTAAAVSAAASRRSPAAARSRSAGTAPGTLPVLDVFDAADAGDPFARELRADLARGWPPRFACSSSPPISTSSCWAAGSRRWASG